MRTLGFRSNVLFAIAAAFGVIAALGRPWYGPSPPPTDARMEDLFDGIARAFSISEGTTGWQAMQSADGLIAGLAVGAAVMSIFTIMPPWQAHVQPLARWFAVGTLIVVAVKLVDEPASPMMSEPRQGLLIALGCALVLVASTMWVAAAPPQRKSPPQAYKPIPPPEYAPDSSYGPPTY
jgi:hypothetical protein